MTQKNKPRNPFLRTVHSIKTQLAVAMLAATLIPLAITTTLSRRTIGQETLALGHQALKGAAQQTAQSLDSFIEKGIYHGTASAALPEIHAYFNSPENANLSSLHDTLQSIRKQDPVFIRHVTLLTPNGQPLASSCEEEMISSHHCLPETRANTLETGQSQLSPIHFDEQRAYLCFYSPVLKDGNPVGLLRISYSAAILQQLISQYTGLLDTSSFPILVNPNNLQIANGILPHGNPEQLYIRYGEPLSEETSRVLTEQQQLPECCQYIAESPSTKNPEIPLLSESVSMKTMPWTVTFFQSEEALLRPVRQQQKEALFLGGGLALLAILAAIWLARRLTAPIQQLTQIAQQATEEMRPLPLNIRSKNEVGALAQSFNQLFDVLSLEQKKLMESEENLRITLDSIGDCVITTDIQGHITGMNPAAEALLEQSLDAVKGLPLSTALPLFDSKTKEPIPDITQEVLTSGITLNLPSKAIFVLPNKQEKFIADSAAPIRNPDGEITGCVLALRDVTEKHQLETRLAQSQKMDALGQMAGGIAHDFNNMLTPILGAAQLLEQDETSDENRKKYAAMISTAGQRAAGLTQQMLTFSRKAPTTTEVIDLREIIDESRAMLQHAIGADISIQTQRPLHPMMTLGDASQIQNIFFNLALNARDAMPKGGTLTFQIKRIQIDVEYCRLHSYEIDPGAYIEVQISDTGEGIDSKDLSKIFDPFFTTKPAGKGTGLGLASVYGVMKKHQGMVSVYSEKDQGTVFHLYFPESAQTQQEETEPAPPAPKGNPTVLLIDDDETVRNISKDILETLGYQAHCAASGAEGIELYQTHQKEISIVMLDLVMPDMNGEETFKQLRKLDPEATVLIISGFDAEESVAGLLQAGAAGFLQKPFQMAPLSKALNRALK